MAKNEKETAAAAPTYDREKVSLEFIDLKELAAAKVKFIGTYLGFRLADGKADSKGVVRQYRRLFFQRRDPSTLALLDLIAINSDKGLVTSLSNGMIERGDTVELEWKSKDPIGNEGHTVNVYDVHRIKSQTMPLYTARLVSVEETGSESAVA